MKKSQHEHPEDTIENELEQQRFAQIVEPDPLPDQNAIPCFRLWGRIWSLRGDTALAFHLKQNCMTGELSEFQVISYGDFTNLEQYNPRMEPDNFLNRLQQYHTTRRSIPRTVLQEAKDSIEACLSDKQDRSEIFRSLIESEEPVLREQAEKLTRKLIERGGSIFQLRGQAWAIPIPDQTQDEDADEEPSQPDDPETEVTDTGESEGDNISRSKTQPTKSSPEQPSRKRKGNIRVTLVSSPLAGVPVKQLQPGMSVTTRIIGELARQLPSHYLDPDRKGYVSHPMPATVKNITPISKLPKNVEGDPKNYRKITVELTEHSVQAFGVARCDERIRVDNSQNQQPWRSQQNPWDSLAILLTSIMLVLFLASLLL